MPVIKPITPFFNHKGLLSGTFLIWNQYNMEATGHKHKLCTCCHSYKALDDLAVTLTDLAVTTMVAREFSTSSRTSARDPNASPSNNTYTYTSTAELHF